jgi:hypothetical protein
VKNINRIGLSFSEELGIKKVTVNFLYTKILFSIFAVLFLIIFIISIFQSSELMIDEKIIYTPTIKEKILYSIPILIFVAILLLLVLPPRLKIIKDRNNDLIVHRRDLLFISGTYIIHKENKPTFVIRKNSKYIFSLHRNSPLLSYTQNGKTIELRLHPLMYYYTKPRLLTTMKEDEAKKISDYLGIELKIEE